MSRKDCGQRSDEMTFSAQEHASNEVGGGNRRGAFDH